MTPYEELVDKQNEVRANLYEKAKLNFYDAWNSSNPKLWTALDSAVCIHQEKGNPEVDIVVRYSCREATKWEIGGQQYKPIWKFYISAEHDSPFVKLLDSFAYRPVGGKRGKGPNMEFYYLSWSRFRSTHPEVLLSDSLPTYGWGWMISSPKDSIEEILHRGIDILSIRYALKKTMDFHTTDWNTITCLKNRPSNNRLSPWTGGFV